MSLNPIPGLGSSPRGARYRYTDTGLTNGTPYWYVLEDIDTASVSTFHGPVSAVPQAPGEGEEEGGGEDVFGLGGVNRVERLTVRWPGGVVQEVEVDFIGIKTFQLAFEGWIEIIDRFYFPVRKLGSQFDPFAVSIF